MQFIFLSELFSDGCFAGCRCSENADFDGLRRIEWRPSSEYYAALYSSDLLSNCVSDDIPPLLSECFQSNHSHSAIWYSFVLWWTSVRIACSLPACRNQLARNQSEVSDNSQNVDLSNYDWRTTWCWMSRKSVRCLESRSPLIITAISRLSMASSCSTLLTFPIPNVWLIFRVMRIKVSLLVSVATT